MTEQEAKNKWCPMARMASPVSAHNRTADDEPEGRCVASKCMMWRWDDNVALSRDGKMYIRSSSERGGTSPGGYCGLAGVGLAP